MRLILAFMLSLLLAAPGLAQQPPPAAPASKADPLVYKQAQPESRVEVIRPIVDKLEPGRLIRLVTSGPSRWTVYEPFDLQVVVENDTSLLFVSPVTPGRIAIFASVEVEGPDIFQPFVFQVGVAPPPVPPTPVPPAPVPPGPNPPVPPTPVPPNPDPVVPDGVPDTFGLGRLAFTEASRVNSAGRAAEAAAVAKVFQSTADRLWAMEDLHDKIYPQIWTETKAAAGANAAAWAPFETALRAKIKAQAAAGKIKTMGEWRLSMVEVAKALSFVK